jgi:phosphoglycerate dehydrogenase-like enzyme
MDIINKKEKVAVCSRSFSMNIVLRDELLSRYQNVTFNDEGIKLSGDSLIKFLKGHDKAITALEVIDDAVLSHLPELKVIGKYGVGLDMIDMDAMTKYGVRLGWLKGVNKRSVSELVVSSAIALLHQTIFANAEVRRGEWYQVKGRQLSDCTVGIIGCGNIGKDIIKLLKPFNCKILSNDLLNFPKFYKDNNVEAVGLEELLQRADIVTLHLPLNQSTRNILNNNMLELMREDAILINFARGGLIDEAVLKERLLSEKLAGAALDVFEVEPPTDLEFAKLKNVLVTPHIGGSTEEAILAMGFAAIDGLDNARDPRKFI